MSIEAVNIWKSAGAGLGVLHHFNDNKKLNIAFDYLYYLNDYPANYDNITLLEESSTGKTEVVKSIKTTPIYFWIGKMDYSNRISTKLVFESGIKGSLSEFKNNVEVNRTNGSELIIDESFSNNTALNEKIFAAYGMLKWAPQKNWNIQGGIRYEFTDTYLSEDVNVVLTDRDYGNFFQV
jgi:outer membrane receptor protein involved in Fe transport